MVEVERALAGAVETARTTLAARQAAVQQASQQRTRLDEARAQAMQRLDSLQAQAAVAATALEDWLRQFQQASLNTRRRTSPPCARA